MFCRLKEIAKGTAICILQYVAGQEGPIQRQDQQHTKGR